MNHEQIAKYCLAGSVGWAAGVLVTAVVARKGMTRMLELTERQADRKQRLYINTLELVAPHVPSDVLKEMRMELEFTMIEAENDDRSRKR